MPTKLTPMQKIMASRAAIRAATPYYSTALLRVQFREVPEADCKATGFSTLGMTDNGVCYYCASFVDGLTPHQTAAVIVHELLHFLRQDNAKFAALDAADPTMKRLTNIACDIANNDDVIGGDWKLPGRPLTHGELQSEAHVKDIYWMPGSVGMPEGRTAHEYLDALRKQAAKQKGKGKGKGQPGGQGGSGAPGSGDGGVCDGECGSAAGSANGIEGRLGIGSKAGQKPGSSPAAKGAGTGQGEDTPGLSASEAERVRAQVAREVASHIQQKGRGSLPAGLARWAEDQLAPPKIPWQQKLQRAARRAVQRKAGAQDYAWTKVSRRQGGLGFGLGAPRMPSLVGNVPQVAVVVDTSGSMGKAQLVEGISETAGVLRAVGSGITFCAIDSATEGLGRVRTWQEAATKLKGGGGTDMKPAFRLLEESRNPPDIIIVITDGMIGDPGSAPKAHVIWLLVGSEYTADVKRFGEVIIAKDAA